MIQVENNLGAVVNLVTKFKVTIEDLDEYANYIHKKKGPRKNLNEYLQIIHKELVGVDVIADLSNFEFSKNNIDLRDCDLSGSILDNIDFDGRYVLLQGVNLKGASLKASKFTNGIDLSGVQFGCIALESNMFVNCQLVQAEYDPSASKVLMYKLTDEQIEDYLSNKSPKPNLNKYLEEKLGYQYPGFKIIADLSGRVINKRFSGADLSESNLERVTITGQIEGLQLRDCFTKSTLFRDCDLDNVDLRGTCLADKGYWLEQGFQAAIFEGTVNLDSAKLSIARDLKLAAQKGLIPNYNTSLESLSLESDELPVLNVSSDSVFDPCYKKGEISSSYRKVTIEEVKGYCASVKRVKSQSHFQEIQDFSSYLGLDKNVYLDLSGLNLKAIDFSFGKFKNCDFSFTNLVGSKFDESELTNCNFSGANMSGRIIDSQFTNLAKWEDNIKGFLNIKNDVVSMKKAVFDHCNFTWANMNGVEADGAEFKEFVGINLNAPNLKINQAIAHDGNFAGAYLKDVQAVELKAKRANFSHAFAVGGNFDSSDLERGNFSHAELEKARFIESSLQASNFFEANLTASKLNGTKLQKAKFAANISAANMDGCLVNSADLSKAKHSKEPVTDKIIGTPLLDVNSDRYREMQLNQQIVNNKKEVYNRSAMIIVAASAALAMVLPLSLVGLGVLSIYAVQPIIVASIMTVSAVATDAFMERILGYSPGVNKIVANLFGAKSLIEVQNQVPHDKQREVAINHDKLVEERRGLNSIKQNIIRVGEDRCKSRNIKSKSFVEEHAKNIIKSQKVHSI